jgi:ribulose-5-phosphate 4-epimerase/fuculose-1-phosphate aldolase
MDDASALAATSGAISPEERAVRVDLAACYRLVASYGWDDLIATHISAAVPGEKGAFLINPFGMLFEEITASSLVKVNLDGEILSKTAYGINAAGYTIHSAIHQVRHDAGCVIHLHTEDGIAVSTLEEGVLPLNQAAYLMIPGVAYHEYEGVALDLDERERLQADLGKKNLMILRNHGTLTVGRTVDEAFRRMFQLEKVCAIQCKTLAMGRPLHPIAEAVLNQPMPQVPGFGAAAASIWAGLLRRLDRMDTGYRD